MSRRIELGDERQRNYVSGYVSYRDSDGSVEAEMSVIASAKNEALTLFGLLDDHVYDHVPAKIKNEAAMAVVKKHRAITEKRAEQEFGDAVAEVMEAARVTLAALSASFVEKRSNEIKEYIAAELKKEGY